MNHPHARGGGPIRLLPLTACIASSPRTWGWTDDPGQVPVGDGIIPTHVGVDRAPRAPQARERYHPHARGGGPPSQSCGRSRGLSSPRTWGWTNLCQRTTLRPAIIPTHVGVDRLRSAPCARRTYHPHARGGGPTESLAELPNPLSSPRTWGWTAGVGADQGADDIIPTHVGVDRSPGSTRGSGSNHPHARGGGPSASPPSSRPRQ